MGRGDSMRWQFCQATWTTIWGFGIERWHRTIYFFPSARQPCRSCASSNNTGFCPGRKFFAQGHFVWRKALPKRHCLLLLSHEHVLHSKIHFRNPSVLQPRWPFGCCSGSKKGPPKKKMWHRAHRRGENLSVLKRPPLFLPRCISDTRICHALRSAVSVAQLSWVLSRPEIFLRDPCPC